MFIRVCVQELFLISFCIHLDSKRDKEIHIVGFLFEDKIWARIIWIFPVKIVTACKHSHKHFGSSLNNHNSHLWNVYRGVGQYIRTTTPVL